MFPPPVVRRLPALLVLIASPTLAGETVDYLRHVKPILKAHCFACHGALKQEGGLRLDTVQALRRGGDSGPGLAAGKPARSLIVQRVSEPEADLRMPREGPPLAAEEIAALKQWIAAGAVAPRDERPESDPRSHWAFQIPVRPAVPPPVGEAVNAIDAFLAASRRRHGLSTVGPARPATLLRRAYLDLIGLPPARQELTQFLADPSDAHYRRIVDRLLASPHHGERWGRHWMDVWRYSDWYGRRRVNDVRNSYPHIWRWRDWIVRSLNENKGYDRMLMEMLAADEIAPTDDENLPALGFIVRNWFSLNYDSWKRDLVEHTGKAFLGLRLNCAHCHDHKYDPITQADYFRFRAFFEPLELRQDRVPGGGALPKFKRYVPGSGGSLRPIAAGLPRVFDLDLAAKTYMYRLGDARDRMDKPPVAPDVPRVFGSVAEEIQEIELPPAAWYPGLKKFVRREEIAAREKQVAAVRDKSPAARKAAEAELAAARARIEADDARYVYPRSEAVQLLRLAVRREQEAARLSAEAAVAGAKWKVAQAEQRPTADKGRAAAIAKARKTLASAKSALSKIVSTKTPAKEYAPFGPQYPRRSTGRRAALARWIASEKNPLTARVAVNHIWLRHFGRPLVESVYDFGRAGAQPTHPKLLDWLAAELMESGWSMKHMHRLVVTSRAYRLRSFARDSEDQSVEKNRRLDADNRFLWRFPSRRLEGEAVRDSILAASGQLDRRVGGPGLDPQGASTTLRRRSLYYSVYPEAGGLLPFVSMFDPPDPCDCYRRQASIVPQQALAMTNSQLMHEASGRLAAKLGAVNDKAFVTAAFERVLSRRPSETEQDICRQFLTRQSALLSSTAQAREGLIRALFNHNDFVVLK